MSAARVSATQVKEIVSTDIADGILTANFIDTAHVFIEAHLMDCGLTEKILDKIELYLAAHFITISDEGGTLKYAKMGDASEAYDTDELGEGFNSTRYGQTAIMLDHTGCLANLAAPGLSAQFRVV